MSSSAPAAAPADWAIPQPTLQYQGPITDIEAFRHARYARPRSRGGSLSENVPGDVVFLREHALQIYNAILQTDDVCDKITPTGRIPQELVDLSNGVYEDDDIWLTAWKLTYDCVEVQDGSIDELCRYTNRARRPTKADPSTSVRIPTIPIVAYDSFQSRFAQVHKLYWYSKAACKNLLDYNLSDLSLTTTGKPEKVIEDKDRNQKNNERRPSAMESRQRLRGRSNEENNTPSTGERGSAPAMGSRTQLMGGGLGSSYPTMSGENPSRTGGSSFDFWDTPLSPVRNGPAHTNQGYTGPYGVREGTSYEMPSLPLPLPAYQRSQTATYATPGIAQQPYGGPMPLTDGFYFSPPPGRSSISNNFPTRDSEGRTNSEMGDRSNVPRGQYPVQFQQGPQPPARPGQHAAPSSVRRPFSGMGMGPMPGTIANPSSISSSSPTARQNHGASMGPNQRVSGTTRVPNSQRPRRDSQRLESMAGRSNDDEVPRPGRSSARPEPSSRPSTQHSGFTSEVPSGSIHNPGMTSMASARPSLPENRRSSRDDLSDGRPRKRVRREDTPPTTTDSSFTPTSPDWD